MSASLQELANVRTRIADITGKISEIERASLTKDDVQDRIKAVVGTLQHRFDQDYIGRGLVGAEYGITTTDILNACTTEETNASDKAIVMLAWLSPDLLERKLLDAAQPYVASGKSAIPTDKRPSLLKKLDSELSELLHQEEELICELQANGHEVFRRANIDPLVVLAAHQE